MDARRPNLADYPGRYVALDWDSDQVVADAATLIDLVAIVRARKLKVSMMRAPREGEPLLVSLG